jgi:hypothetical protein
MHRIRSIENPVTTPEGIEVGHRAPKGAVNAPIIIVYIEAHGVQIVKAADGITQGETGIPVLDFMNPGSFHGKLVFLSNILILGIKGDIREPVGAPPEFTLRKNIRHHAIVAQHEVMFAPLMLEIQAPIGNHSIRHHFGGNSELQNPVIPDSH